MTSAPDDAVVPAWVAPPHAQVVELHHLAYRLAEVIGDAEARGRLAAVEWVVGLAPAPVTHRRDAASWEQARAESWVALSVAAGEPAPTAADWARLGVTAEPAGTADVESAYGAWRTLAWLLGVRSDPPVELPERYPDGSLVGGPRYATRPNPASPAWLEAQERRRERAGADARRHWEHVRRLADR